MIFEQGGYYIFGPGGRGFGAEWKWWVVGEGREEEGGGREGGERVEGRRGEGLGREGREGRTPGCTWRGWKGKAIGSCGVGRHGSGEEGGRGEGCAWAPRPPA